MRVLAVAAATVLVVFAVGCPARRTAAELQRNPGRYNGKDVTIIGVVKTSYGVSVPGMKMGGGVYEIDDGTGSIWVIADERGTPPKGTEIAVSGTFGNAVTWNGKSYGQGVFEKNRHYARR
jgi:hypothetical protein